jgi:flagellar protein FliS
MNAPQSSLFSSMAQRYRQIGNGTAVDSASPHRLITLLFDGLLESMSQARYAIRNKKIEAKTHAINRAISITVQGLKGGLNMKDGGQIAQRLDALYAYVSVRLSHANLRNDEAAIEECQRLIEPIRDAWVTIGTYPEVNMGVGA